jgi:putative hemolysin
MDVFWLQLALVAALILLNAAFAGSELALVTLRDARLKRLGRRGKAGAALVRLTSDPNRFLATIQIGITLAGFLASATAAVTLAEPLVELLGSLGRAARPVAILLVTVALTFVTLVVGELAPKRIAMQRAEAWGLVAARPLAALATLARPAIWLLSHATDVVVRLFGGDPGRQRADVTEEELRDIVAVQPELTEEERAIITSVFELGDRSLRQVVTPRHGLVALPSDLAASEGARRLVDAGHSRAPVYTGDIDDVVGIAHLRDLVAGEGVAADHARPALVLPETVKALDALRSLQTRRQQMAVVVNEHGATEGIVTIEDLVEELVGEIWDEADPDVQAVVREADGSVVVAGSYPVHDLDEIGVDLPAGDYTTVAGLVLHELGRIPTPGERLEVGRWSIDVLRASARAIRRVRLAPISPEPDPPR